jgi:O-antigen/teichoic acid export membrane protein
MSTTANNQRLVKNTLFLYLRMFLTMGIALYTSRVNLASLGIENYGVYNIVGGTVALFSFINITLTGATSRFLTFEMGANNKANLNKTFRTSLSVHLIIAFVILCIAETIGLWLLNNKINIPIEKTFAASVVFQISILTSVISILQVPFTASIISHENMGVYAYISIYECLAKLGIAYIIYVVPNQKLIVFASLIALVHASLFFIYVVICLKKYDECVIKPSFEKNIMLPILRYSGWDLYGNLSSVARTYGIAVVLNMFFGVVVNAAVGIANQVQSAVMGFVENFMTALRPQIVKYFASGDVLQMTKLICAASKYSFILFFFVSFPLIIENHYVLNLWLKEIPDYAVAFTQFSLMIGWNSALFRPVVFGIHAVGKIRNMSIINGTIILLIIPISYLAFYSGLKPVWAYVINLCLLLICSFINLFQMHQLINAFSILYFLRNVLIDALKVVLPTALVAFLITNFWEESLLRFILSCMSFSTITLLITYFFVADSKTRMIAKNFIYKKLLRR